MTTHQNKNFFHLMTLTVPVARNKDSGIKSAIVSSISINDNKLTFEPDYYQRMHALGLRNFNLVIINNDLIGYNRNVIKDNHLNAHCSLTLHYINVNTFFSLNSFEFFFNKNKDKSFEFVFAFQNINWDEICVSFVSAGIDISGGSNTKKHLISPVQHRLSLFLMCIFGTKSSYFINESFHREFKASYKKGSDLSTKERHNLIIDFTRANEILKSRILAEGPIDFSLIEDFNENEESKTTSTLNNNKNNSELNSQINNNNSTQHNNNDTIEKPSFNGKDNDNKGCVGGNLNNIKINPVAVTLAPGKNRKYHSSACLFDNKKSNVNELSDLESIAPHEYIGATTDKFMTFPKNTILANFIVVPTMEQEITSAGLLLTSDESKRQQIQLKFENTWLNLIEESIKDDKIFINKHQSLLFKSLISAKDTLNIMSENKYLTKKFPELGDDLNKIEYIILTYSICVSLHQRLGYTALAGKAGGDILYLVYKNALCHNKSNKSSITSQLANSLLLTSDINFSEFKNLLNIDEEYQLILGDFFMSILQTFPNAIFNRDISKDSFYTKNTVKLGINSEYLEDIKKNLIINPNTLPMLCKPTEWTNTNHGGFLSNDNRAIDIITGINEYGHIVENKEPIFKAVNYLNSIKFGVNTDLLNYILSPEGSYILENIKPEDELQRIITLNVAYVYRNTYFYLNTHADWRGRLYTKSFYLSYQGGDLSTALLNFWEGEAINEEGKIYLCIYGANSHNEKGISKASFEERIKWVKLNYDKIINLDKVLILSAENPFVFTAFCLNMRKIHNNPKAVIKTPLFLDATCSGIQHLAALMKDLELGSQTNLIPSKMEEGPGDIYDSLLEPINKAINKFGEDNLDYSLLGLVKLTRKEVKRSIMTKVYNVTVYGISQQLQGLFEDSISKEHDSKKNEVIQKIQNDLESELKSNKKKTKFKCPGKDGKSITLDKKEIFKIASVINDQIFINYPSLNNIYNYFVDITKLSAKLGTPMTWITPSGLKITQNYLKKINKVISVSIFGKVKKIVLKTKLNELDRAKQSQAIIPNIIHSLDASHLMNIIKTASEEKFYPLIPIHDCFGTLPNLMGELEHKVKKEFILIYSDSKFLTDFHQRFLQSITDNQYNIINKDGKSFVIYLKEELEIPSIPKLGELDIQNIINSKYMIS